MPCAYLKQLAAADKLQLLPCAVLLPVHIDLGKVN